MILNHRIRFVVLLLSVTSLFVYAEFFYCDEECTYKNKFLSIDRIRSIHGYYNYENHRYIEIEIDKGDTFYIGDFDNTLFELTGYVALLKIGGYTIDCLNSESGNKVLNGFNLIDYVNDYSGLPTMNNIDSIVNHYEDIYSSLVAEMGGGKKKQYKFTRKDRGVDKLSVVCSLS